MSITPANIRYTSGGKPVAIPSSRRIVRVIPESGTSGYNPETNPVIRIPISPSLGFIDTHNSYLSFRVKIDPTKVDMTKPCRLDKHAMSWCRTFTIYSSTGAQLEHIESANLLCNMLFQATAPDDYKESIGKMIQNQGDRATRNAAMAHPAGSLFNSGLDFSGIMGSQSLLLPASFFQGEMMMEFTLDQFQNCFVGAR